jgi:hypothetical protein
MSEENLRKIAQGLMNKEPTYWGDFPEPFLMAWLDATRHRPDHAVLCQYCDLPLMSVEPTSFRHGTVDHLLPKRRYKELELDRLNGVPCCYRCNAVKGRWDPNGEDPVYSPGKGRLEVKQREVLTRRARTYVQGKLATAHPRISECWKRACEELD